jgi:hypothetical protein
VHASGHTTAPGGERTVEFSTECSEKEGRWWVSRIGADQASRKVEERFISAKRPLV